ncbi:hypothetical protein BT69DRAFT_1331816 [Atractiella rhizophila]|nr:hypothetical protein BT69DRAFT_1331816 [Atractiella rhizophila]
MSFIQKSIANQHNVQLNNPSGSGSGKYNITDWVAVPRTPTGYIETDGGVIFKSRKLFEWADLRENPNQFSFEKTSDLSSLMAENASSKQIELDVTAPNFQWVIATLADPKEVYMQELLHLPIKILYCYLDEKHKADDIAVMVFTLGTFVPFTIHT